MLADTQSEKSRNPLKLAMRRRNAKTVQFAAPTYVEASDYDYSDDEEHDGVETLTNGTTVDDPAVNGQPAEVDERNAPEEANVHATRRYSGDQTSITSKSSLDSTHKASFEGPIGEDPQLSPKLVDRSEAAPLKSRKGTPRNTDSFLKDDSIETRKITLTPGILREDGNNAMSSKSSSIDSQRNPSMESLTKSTSPESTSSSLSKKDSGKKKEKNKGGMLSGLFKSKKREKKNGKDDDAVSDGKSSAELPRGSSQTGSTSPVDRDHNIIAAATAAGRDVQVQGRSAGAKPEVAPLATTRSDRDIAELQGSEAAFEMVGSAPDLAVQPPQSGNKVSALSPVTGLLKQASKAKRAKQRVELDDFDTPEGQHNPFNDPDDDDAKATMSPSGTITDGADFVHIPTAFNDNEDDIEEPASNRIASQSSNHPKQSEDSQRATTDDDTELFADARENVISPSVQSEKAYQSTRPASAQPPARGGSTSSHSSSEAEAETPKSVSVISHDSKQQWDDGALRAWLDAEDVKDMLTIVHSSGHASGPLQPAPDDHPLMRGLYVEERGAVDRMMTELDTLLMGFASRKGLA